MENTKSDDYFEINSAHVRDANNLIDRIVDESGNVYRIVLDIGCGCGKVTSLLNQRIIADKIVAIDVDLKMIKYAKSNYCDANIEYLMQDIGVVWSKLDPVIRQLEGKVDLIFSNRVLHWVDDKSNAIKNLHRLLAPNCTLYANITTLWDLFEDQEDDQLADIQTIVNIPPLDEQLNMWAQFFNDSGFINTDMDFVVLKQLYPCEQFNKALLPYFPELTKRYLIEKDQFRRDMIMASGLRDLVKRSMLKLYCRKLSNGTDGKPEYELSYGQCRIVATKT